MEMIQTHHREDRINQNTLNLATRLNRSITDQVSSRLEKKASNGRKVLIFCGADEPEELGDRSRRTSLRPMDGRRGLPVAGFRMMKC